MEVRGFCVRARRIGYCFIHSRRLLISVSISSDKVRSLENCRISSSDILGFWRMPFRISLLCSLARRDRALRSPELPSRTFSERLISGSRSARGLFCLTFKGFKPHLPAGWTRSERGSRSAHFERSTPILFIGRLSCQLYRQSVKPLYGDGSRNSLWAATLWPFGARRNSVSWAAGLDQA